MGIGGFDILDALMEHLLLGCRVSLSVDVAIIAGGSVSRRLLSIVHIALGNTA
jgi:hypothetical protein